jgi:hypothetical protein
MRVAAGVLVLTALAVLGVGPARGGVATPPAPEAPRCDSPGGASAEHPRPKPSALAPRRRSGSHVYGAPIQQPIFRTRAARKSEQRGASQGNQPQR